MGKRTRQKGSVSIRHRGGEDRFQRRKTGELSQEEGL